MKARGRLDRRANGVDPRPVALHAGQAPPLRPSPVSVHDDGDMARQAGEVQPVEERTLRRAGRAEAVLFDHRFTRSRTPENPDPRF